MFKNIFFLFILFFSFNSEANPEIDVQQVAGIRELKRKIEALNLPVEETVFIFDCDGVLTCESEPKSPEAAPRGWSVKYVKSLLKKGYRFLVSSAWADFDATLHKVHELGLAQELGVNNNDNDDQRDFVATLVEGKMSAPEISKDIRKEEGERLAGRVVRIAKEGRVISVAGKASDKVFVNKGTAVFYRQKAYAPMIAYPGKKFKHVVFVDDSRGNIEIFARDIQSLPYARESKVHCFALPRINGQSVRADRLDVDTDDEETSGEYDEPSCSSSSDEIVAGEMQTLKIEGGREALLRPISFQPTSSEDEEGLQRRVDELEKLLFSDSDDDSTEAVKGNSTLSTPRIIIDDSSDEDDD